MFLKKTKSVAEAITGVDGRIRELGEKRDAKATDIEEKRGAISKLLASLAMAENEKDAESLKLARKSLERLTENFNDLTEQLSMLQGSREGLQKELLEARIRDLPASIEAEATAFNSIFNEAVKAVEQLRTIQVKMLERQNSYKALSQEYDACCRSLEVIQPLQVIGLGVLANVGGAYHSSFTVPEDTATFCQSIIIYEAKIKDSADFVQKNPGYQESLEATNNKDSKPWEFHLLQNRKIFGRDIR